MSNEFVHEIKVYYEDTDSGGVVYYSNYLKFLERARTEMITLIGLSNKKLLDDYKMLIIVKSCNVEYLKPAMLEDKLEIDFIQAFKEQLSTWADSGFKDMTLGDLKNNPPEGMDIDNALEKWIPKQGDTQGRSVAHAGGGE